MRCLRQAKIIASVNLWLRHQCHQPQRDNCKFSHLTQREKGYSYGGQKSSTLAKTGCSRTGKGFPIPYRTGFSSPNKKEMLLYPRDLRNNLLMFCWQRKPPRIKFYPVSAYFLRVFQHLLWEEAALRWTKTKDYVNKTGTSHTHHPSAQAITPDTALSSTNTLPVDRASTTSTVFGHMNQWYHNGRPHKELQNVKMLPGFLSRAPERHFQDWKRLTVTLQNSALSATTFLNNPYAMCLDNNIYWAPSGRWVLC